MSAITADHFLNGRVQVAQLNRGFRSGLDAVMLAAAVPARSGDTVLELGSGAGAASLCLAARAPGCMVVGVEIGSRLVSIANRNVAANATSDRVRFVEADVLNLPRDLRRQYDHVLCNPPFHRSEGDPSPDAGRARALQDGGALFRWLECGLKRTAANGTFTAILRADRLGEALAALPQEGVAVFPLWPKAGVTAKRLLIQIRRGSRAAFALLPGLVLHEPDGRYTPEADAILRGGAALVIGKSRL